MNEILAEADEAAEKAEQAERKSRDASDNASKYGLTGVILAGALLFAGLTPQLRGRVHGCTAARHWPGGPGWYPSTVLACDSLKRC